METKLSKVKIESLKTTLGFDGCFGVASEGLSGGIAMFWTTKVLVDLKYYSSCHIDVMVRKNTSNATERRVNGFYGAPRVEDRHHS
jgi:hypothetical protein